jgi:hypothetical protein
MTQLLLFCVLAGIQLAFVTVKRRSDLGLRLGLRDAVGPELELQRSQMPIGGSGGLTILSLPGCMSIRIQIISQSLLILRRHLDKLESIPDLNVFGNHDRFRPNLPADLQIYI